MTELSYRVERCGQEQQPVVIIDDFHSDPKALMDFAKSQRFEKRGPFYPGIRAAGDVNYLAERMSLLTIILKNVFGVMKGVKEVECNYSLVTTRPEDLMPIQALPHFDGLDTGRFALLHYLSGAEKGGTAFYRHRSTGFETVTKSRFETYKNTLEKEVVTFGLPPKCYFNGPSEQFEQILEVDAKPNRMIIYRGITLHSGYIPDGFDFNKRPDLGRLTINTFLQDKSPNKTR